MAFCASLFRFAHGRSGADQAHVERITGQIVQRRRGTPSPGLRPNRRYRFGTRRRFAAPVRRQVMSDAWDRSTSARELAAPSRKSTRVSRRRVPSSAIAILRRAPNPSSPRHMRCRTPSWRAQGVSVEPAARRQAGQGPASRAERSAPGGLPTCPEDATIGSGMVRGSAGRTEVAQPKKTKACIAASP